MKTAFIKKTSLLSKCHRVPETVTVTTADSERNLLFHNSKKNKCDT